MAKKRKKRSRRKKYLWETGFRPYAIEIGYLLREWNDLQNALSELFATILGIADQEVSLAMWHAIPNDRFQRRVLRAAAKRVLKPPLGNDETEAQKSNRRMNEAIWEEIEWILDRSDGLGSQRDSAAHSPVAFILQEPLEFIAHHISGHPSAQSLKGKNLLSEFSFYRNKAEVLRFHTEQLDEFIRAGKRSTFPDRPELPTQTESSARKSPRLGARARPRFSPPQS